MLQGGGALGAYQAGVFEGLAEAKMRAALGGGHFHRRHQCALIAGNPPAQRVEKLREFWQTVTAPPLLPGTQGHAAARTALGWFDTQLRAIE